ncbi:ATP-binding protein [Oribacterium sp. NK2B42]|uniref:ATP-binding protein n=1 Tax=Oribacterium sp. NK2B42 TaxID=689781 RepID=UPI0003F76D42|nr:ATP-binding protein [Oribacterium sp. NK2B42]
MVMSGQTQFNLKNFDSYREDNRLEVKKAKGGLPKSLWDTYSSFANTYGGCIILGVVEHEDHTWETCGLKDVSKFRKDFWDVMNNPEKVSINLLREVDVTDYEINGDVILVIRVPRATRDNKPVFINGDMFAGTFKRNWEGDYHCTKREVLAMLRDQADDTPDMKILKDYSISDFDKNSIRAYRVRYNTRHDNHPWTQLPDDEFLVRIGAAKEYKGKIVPTAAGLLMFGQEYLITTEFPEYFLDYREKLDPNIRWTDRVQSQSGDWSGNIFDFFAQVYPKVTADFKKPFMTEGPYRVEETPKHLAVREAIANCLVNTDYFQSWSVVIERYPDRITLANPGLVRLGKEQMLKGGISEPRNKNLFKMFNLIGVGEHAGSGVPDIFEVWKREKLEAPTVEEQFGADKPDRTIINLPLLSANLGTDLGTSAYDDEVDKKKLILEFCVRERSKAEIQEYLKIKSERYVRQKLITPLILEGKLRRTIPDKPQSKNQKYIAT